jgi:hypothetical protein
MRPCRNFDHVHTPCVPTVAISVEGERKVRAACGGEEGVGCMR